MLFRDIVGHDDIKQRLIKSVNENHIPHAQLFSGIAGLGKLPLALAYAQYIQCTNRGLNDSCGVCPSCIKHQKLMHPDMHYVFPVIKKDENTVCYDYIRQWREFLSDNVYFSVQDWTAFLGSENKQAGIFTRESDEIIKKLTLKPYESDYRVMLIWLPERMNDATSNKILKILEEPYDKTYFILVSNEPDKLLSTIISRTQRVNFRPLDEKVICEVLKSEYSVDAVNAYQIAHLANGNFYKAVSNISVSDEKSQFFNLFITLMRSSYARKIFEMKAWSDEMAALGRERQLKFLNYAQQMIRENFIMNMQDPQLNYMTLEEQNFSLRFSPFVNERNTMQIMEELQTAEEQIAQNCNAKIVFFDMSLKFIMLLKNQ